MQNSLFLNPLKLKMAHHCQKATCKIPRVALFDPLHNLTFHNYLLLLLQEPCFCNTLNRMMAKMAIAKVSVLQIPLPLKNP